MDEQRWSEASDAVDHRWDRSAHPVLVVSQ
jgi:hypothetical protein